MKDTLQSQKEIFQRFLHHDGYGEIAKDNRVSPQRIRQIIVKQQQQIAQKKRS